jgi:hypothetical protein
MTVTAGACARCPDCSILPGTPKAWTGAAVAMVYYAGFPLSSHKALRNGTDEHGAEQTATLPEKIP